MAEKTLYYDGLCGLCDGWVQFVLRCDKSKSIKFCALQSDHAKTVLGNKATDLTTLIYQRNKHIYTESTAVLFCLWDMGGILKFSALYLVIPKFIRDGIYKWVARNRYRFFDKRTECRLPEPNAMDRFIS